MEVSFQNNIFNTDFNNFNAFLANFNNFGEFKVCLKTSFCDISCYVEVTHFTFNES